MTRGYRGSEPTGLAGDAFYVLAMYQPADGSGMTLDALHAAITREDAGYGPAPARAQVHSALKSLAGRDRHPPLAERARPGNRGVPARWRVTDHGERMIAVWCGEDPEPVRVPCGLGWPA